MKRGMFMLPLLAAVAFLNGQIANNWVFGYRCGLNFATDPPSYLTDSVDGRSCINHNANYGSYASNSISDCDGNLLFYTNGEVVWNKNHLLMLNGCLNDSIPGGSTYKLKTKILKLINNDSLYYVFYSLGTNSGLRYAIVNMNADNGKGNIISNHNLINNFYNGSSFQYVTPPELIKHANDSDYWLVCKPTDSEVYSYLITSQGINLIPVISSVPGAKSIQPGIKASLSGNFIVLWTPLYNDTAYICNFNRATGIASNKKLICRNLNAPHIFQRVLSVEFSPNDSLVYMTTYGDSFGYNIIYRLIQIQPYLANPINFANTLYSNSSGSSFWFVQLAPDGKIYISNGGGSILSCIARPDEFGTACNFVYNYLDFSPNEMWGGLPSVYFHLKRLKFNAKDFSNTSCLTDSIRLYVQGDTSFLNYRWYFYDSNNTLTDSTDVKNPVLWLNPGKYYVKLRARNHECYTYTWWTDDIYVNYKPQIGAVIDSTKITCGKQELYLHYSSAFKDSIGINWGDGTYEPWKDTSGNFNASHDYNDSSKIYTITITAIRGNCTTTVNLKDTVILEPKPKASFFANNNTKTFPITGCTPLNINLTDSSQNADSVWFILNNASGIHSQFSPAISGGINSQLTDTGWFDIIQYVTNKNGCFDSFVVNSAVYVAPKPTIQILKDTTYNTCLQNNLRLKINTSYNDTTLINWGDGNSDKLVGIITGSSIDTITHYYINPGSYIIHAVSKNQYCDTQTFLTHLVRPPLQMIASNDTTLCKGTFTSIWAIGSGGDSMFSYILKTPSVILQNTSGLFLIPPDSTTTYTIGAINACANDTLWKQITVTLRPPLALLLNTTDTTICKGSTLTINATATGGNGNYNYILKKNNITQQNNTTGIFNITANSNEIYTVVLRDNCTVVNDSLICKINIYNILQLTQNLPDIYLCAGESTTLKANTNNGSGTVNYEWRDAGGTILSTLDTLYLIPNTSTQIILKVTDACISIYDTVWIYEFATSGSTQLLTDAYSGCVPLTVNFETPTLTYSNSQPCDALWDFGDGSNLAQNFNSSNSSLKAKHKYKNAGAYQVKVEVKFKNGSNTCYTFSTTVEALLIPQISLSIVPKKITLPKTQCTATITTMNSDSVVIDWGDGYSLNLNLNLNLITQTHDYADTGHYMVKATAYNKNTCYTETQTSIYHADTFICFIPNAFSPNRDVTNETFKPVVSFCKSYELTIYNRWGEVVYETTYIAGKSMQPAWSGEGSPADTYIYMFTATDGDNLRHNFKGTVMLLR